MNNINELMYGSIHTHFESDYDAVNAHFNDKGKISFDQALNEFYKLGAKKVAVTEHGSFASFEDIYEASKKFEGLDVIPGCEVYLEYNNSTNSKDRAHLILIAKDREGYLSLCKIISESNHNIQHGTTKDYPIVSYENLEKNLNRGHIIATSACIAGPLCKHLKSDLLFTQNKIEKLRSKLEKYDYFSKKEEINKYEQTLHDIMSGVPTKEELKEIKEKKDKELMDTARGLVAEAKEKMKSPEFIELQNKKEENEKYIKKYKLTRTINDYNANLDKLRLIKAERKDNTALKETVETYNKLHKLFGNDFYFELQNHHLPEEKEIYNLLVRFAIAAGNPKFIASNDIHICMKKDNPEFGHEVERRKVAKHILLKKYEPDRIDEYEYGIKTDEELREELLQIIEPYKDYTSERIVDEAIGNIKNVLAQCNTYEHVYEDHYPKFCNNDKELLEEKIKEGLNIKFPDGFPKEKEDIYKERLKKEINIIESMGYSSYHLIVQDYLTYGRLLGYLPKEKIKDAPLDIEELDKYITENNYKRRGYSIGPGRGSAAGSLVCYLLGITDIDPIKYNLLFERFLNPERKSMPDIDSDFSLDIREKCFEYCSKKYGANNTCRIMTKTYQNSKGAVRLAGRYLGSKEYFHYEDNLTSLILPSERTAQKEIIKKKWNKVGDGICKLIDEREKERYAKENNKSEEQNEINPTDFSEIIDDGEIKEEEVIDDGSLQSLLNDSRLTEEGKECVKIACYINGIHTVKGEHACGNIISKDDLSTIIPIMYNSKLENFSTQCTMAQAESLGLLKMDFLNLKNLTIITEILKETDDPNLQDYSIRDEVLNDPLIFKDIYCSGKTLGVFQFESPGMTKMLKELQPDCFEDIIAAISLYRPGPMDFIPQYIEGKHHPEKVIYKCDALKEILSPTYGTIVYQEQVMQIFQAVGYTLGGADAIRKAMGKKHEEEIEAERNNFIYGNAERNINGAIKDFGMTEAEATELFDVMKKFGRYAFNKSHATAYAMVSLFTAYLKKYHTLEFYKYTLRRLPTEKRNKQMSKYINEMREFGIEMKAPSLLQGNMEFEIDKKKKYIYFGFSDIKDMSVFNIEYKTDCLQEFVQNNLNVSKSTLLTLAKIGCFKTIWINDTEEADCISSEEWINKYKDNIDKMAGYLNSLKSLKIEIPIMDDEKLKEKSKKDYIKIQNKCNEILSDLSEGYKEYHNSEHKNNDLIQYSNEKKLCYSVLSAKEKIGELKDCPSDFSLLNNDKNINYIGAMVVGISEEKKTKSSNKPYRNVDLMDKNGVIITRRFETIPQMLKGIYSIPSQWAFNCKEVKELPKKNNTIKMKTFQNTINDLILSKIDIKNIQGINNNKMGSNKMLFMIDENKDDKGEIEICEER